MSNASGWGSNRVTPTHILITAATLVIIGAIGYFLSTWRSVLVPVAIAFMSWFLISALSYRIHKITRLPRWISQLFTIVALASLFYVAGRIIIGQFWAIQAEAPLYQAKLTSLFRDLATRVGLENSDINMVLDQFNFVALAGSLANTARGILTTSLLVLLYVLLLSLEQHLFPMKMTAIFGKGEAHTAVQQTLTQIQRRVQSYVAVKTLVSFLTGAISCVIMLAAGVDHGIFWAFLIFMLNYIPNIGSVIAVLMPVLMTLLQTGDWGATLGLAVALTIVQQILGSIVEPRLMGSSLNISPFVVLLSLTVWGSMWGLPGMFLCVPLTVVAMIIMAEFPNTRAIALLLSRDGSLTENRA
jgi:predicted PurR-regulated permease PerM